MANITLKNIVKKYGNITAIKGVNFEVKDKEFLVLVGPSGCGKSTLLRMIAGLEEITSGELSIGDKVVNKLPPKDRDIAIVFQNYALYPHMTAYNNMAFGLKIRGINKKIIHEKVLATAKILEIEPLLDRKPKAMSGGQRQRIAIGRAIIRDPKVFLFDEPLSNLDAKLRGQMRLEIAKLHRRLQTTIVYVTHDQVEAMTLGDRIVVLNQGEVQQIDTPQNLYRHPANQFVAGFIGTPPMNFIVGEIIIEQGQAFFVEQSGAFRIPLSTKKTWKAQTATLGIRPEHISAQPQTNSHFTPFATKVQYIEQLGHEGFAFCEVGTQQISARISTEHQFPKVGLTQLAIQNDKVYLFETGSGELL